jgi:hypothetical protein
LKPESSLDVLTRVQKEGGNKEYRNEDVKTICFSTLSIATKGRKGGFVQTANLSTPGAGNSYYKI